MFEPGTLAGLLVGAGLGVVTCYRGYALVKFLIAVWGCLAVGLLTGVVLLGATQQPVLAMAGGLLLGLLGGWLLVQLYFVGVFVLGFLCGLLASAPLLLILGLTPAAPVALLLALIVGVLGGLAALMLQRTVLVVATAMLGGGLLASCIYCLLTGLDPQTICPVPGIDPLLWLPDPLPPEHAYFLIGGWVIATATGILVQSMRREKESSPAPAE